MLSLPVGLTVVMFFSGLPKNHFAKLQLLQNSAAHSLTKTRCAHITPVLKSLQWLPMWFRMSLKILELVFTAIVLAFLADLLLSCEPARTFRS